MWGLTFTQGEKATLPYVLEKAVKHRGNPSSEPEHEEGKRDENLGSERTFGLNTCVQKPREYLCAKYLCAKSERTFG